VAIVYYSEKLKLAFRFQSSLFPNNIQLEPKSAGTVGVVAVCSHSFVPLVLIFMETRGKIFTLLASRVGFLNLVRKLGVKKKILSSCSRRALVVLSSSSRRALVVLSSCSRRLYSSCQVRATSTSTRLHCWRERANEQRGVRQRGQRRLDYTAGVRERTNREGFVRELSVGSS